MRIGIDFHHGFLKGPMTTSEHMRLAYDEGYAGIYYKSPMDLSKTLDSGELEEAHAIAREYDLFLDFGVGRVNPYNTNETPEVWELSGGDYMEAMKMQISAGLALGCRDFIGVTAGWKGNHKGRFVYDRFRTDVTWEEQLQATSRFLQRLAPFLRDVGARVNLETHEEITSEEILHLIEEVGEDVLGIALDTGNVIARAEDPIRIAKLVAPYTHQMHIKDCLLLPTETGLVRRIRPVGEGCIDFHAVLGAVYACNPDIHIQIEDHKGSMHLDFYDPQWLALHPEISPYDMSRMFLYARECEARITNGELPEPEAYEAIPYPEQRDQRQHKSLMELRKILVQLETGT